MRCNWRRWLWGIVPLLVLTWIVVEIERPRIEQELTERARLALSQSGASWAGAQFLGRDALLSGKASDEGEAPKAVDTLRTLWGVRVVDNKADLIEKAETYTWSAGRRASRIRLSGYAPNLATKQAILGVAKANFPGFEVVDRMTLARGVPTGDTWLGGVSFGLKQLASMQRGDVRLEGLAMSVAGEAEDIPAYRALKTALAGAVPKGIKLANSQVTPPAVSPYTWSAQFRDGQLVLSGYVPNDTAREELLTAARSSAPGTTIVDRMEPAEGAPPGWANAAVASVKELPRLESGSAEIKDAVLIVSGMAADEAAAEAIRNSLRGALSATIKLTEQIRFHKPPPPPPPPAVEPPRPPPAAEAIPVVPPLPPALVQPPLPPDLTAPKQAEPAAPAPAPRDPAPPQRQAEAAPVAPPPAPPQRQAEAVPVAPPPARAEPAPPSRAEPAPPSRAEPAPPAPKAEPVPPQTAAAPPPVVTHALTPCQEKAASLKDQGVVLFEVNSAKLDAASFATLERLAEAARTCPSMRIAIGGHTDTQGKARYNQGLSARRARAVIAYLRSNGVTSRQLESAAFGDKRPAVPNDTPDNMARNRRVELVVRLN